MTTGIKILITAIAVAAGTTLLAFNSSGGTIQYYKHVDEVLVDPARWTKEEVIQIHGYARKVPLKGEFDGQKISRTFELEKNGRVIGVRHEGVVPDNFKDNSETVVKGRLVQEGDRLVLITVGGEQGIMAKCPSKYDGNR